MSENGTKIKNSSSDSSTGKNKANVDSSGKSSTAENSLVKKEKAKLDAKDHAKFFNLFVLTTYIIADMKKKPRSYKIGIFTVTLTITFVIVLYSILDLLPLVFLKQAQNTVGESDLIYTAIAAENISVSVDRYMYNEYLEIERSVPADSSLPFINFTQMQESAQGNKHFEGFSPRWFGVADFINPDDDSLKASGILMILDTEREVRIGLGRDFTKQLLGEYQAFVTTSALKYLDIEPNGRNKIQLSVDFRDYLKMFFGTNNPLTTDDIQTLSDELDLGFAEGDTINVNSSSLINTTQISDDTGLDLSFLDDITGSIPISDVYQLIVDNQENVFVLRVEYTVMDSFDTPNGKFANNYGNVVVIDSQYLLSSIQTAINANLNGIDGGSLIFSSLSDNIGFLDQLDSININEYAFEVDAVLKDRESFYLDNPTSNEAKILSAQREMNLDLLVTANAPVLDSLEQLYFMMLFLQSTFATIVFFMVLLSVMLIYSLMISDVDEKTYEMGMLRALGLRKVSLMNLIIIQSMIFSIVGVIIGVIISQILNVCVRYLIFTYSVAHISYLMSVSASLVGVGVGLFMPIASNIWAIKRALGKTIRDSLDVFHTGVNEVMVRIVRLASFGISPFEIVLGTTLVATGVLTYLVAPAAFLYDRLDLFFLILNLILVGMIIGLAFLCFLIFPYVQTLLIYLITFLVKTDTKLRPLILKNLNHSHKARNLKTSMLFTIALAYLVFGGSSLLLIGNLIIGFVKSFLGGDVVVTSIFSANDLPEYAVRSFLESEIAGKDSRIEVFAFRGIEWSDYMKRIFEESISLTISNTDFPTGGINIYPVEETYTEACLIDYYIPKYPQNNFDFEQTGGKDDYVKALYSNEGITDYGFDIDPFNVKSRNLTDLNSDNVSSLRYNPTQQLKLIMPEGIRDVLSVSGGDTIKLTVGSKYESDSGSGSGIVHRVLIRGLPKKMPGFFFSSYKQVQFFLQTLSSLPQLFEFTYLIAQGSSDLQVKYNAYIKDPVVANTTYFYPKDRLLVKLDSSLDQDERDIVVNQISGLLNDDLMLVFDVKKFEASVRTTLLLLQVFIIIVGAIAFIISFFLLLVSTTSNIKENIWEFGVLRAIGLRKDQIVRIYLYESLAVTISACILGFILGFILALTLSLQFNLFLELPFYVAFPYALAFTMIGLAIITTVIGTVIPLSHVNSLPIAGILKNAS